MGTTHRNKLTKVMNLAWDFVKKYGYNLSDALKKAWANIKLKANMAKGIVKFRFLKTDGVTIREAYGTLKDSLVPATMGNRKQADWCQTYFDTEKNEWRSFRKVNLLG